MFGTHKFYGLGEGSVVLIVGHDSDAEYPFRAHGVGEPEHRYFYVRADELEVIDGE